MKKRREGYNKRDEEGDWSFKSSFLIARDGNNMSGQKSLADYIFGDVLIGYMNGYCEKSAYGIGVSYADFIII